MGVRNKPLTSVNGVLSPKRAAHSPRKNIDVRINNNLLKEKKDESDAKRPRQVDNKPTPRVSEVDDIQKKTLVVEDRVLDIGEIDEGELRLVHPDNRAEDLPDKELGQDVDSGKDDTSVARSTLKEEIKDSKKKRSTRKKSNAESKLRKPRKRASRKAKKE